MRYVLRRHGIVRMRRAIMVVAQDMSSGHENRGQSCPPRANAHTRLYLRKRLRHIAIELFVVGRVRTCMASTP